MMLLHNARSFITKKYYSDFFFSLSISILYICIIPPSKLRKCHTWIFRRHRVFAREQYCILRTTVRKQISSFYIFQKNQWKKYCVTQTCSRIYNNINFLPSLGVRFQHHNNNNNTELCFHFFKRFQRFSSKSFIQHEHYLIYIHNSKNTFNI